MPFIPMYWIITILNALKKMVLREESVDDALKEMASNIGKSAAAPFFFIFFSFLYFFIKTGRAIGEISQLIWGKRPKFPPSLCFGSGHEIFKMGMESLSAIPCSKSHINTTLSMENTKLGFLQSTLAHLMIRFKGRSARLKILVLEASLRCSFLYLGRRDRRC